MMYCGVEIALNAGAHLAECPLWDNRENVLRWIDVFRGEVHRFDPSSGIDTHFGVPSPVGSIALRDHGGLLLALRDGLYTMDEGQDPVPVALPEPERTGNHFNDGRTDRQGRFWVGSRNLDEAGPTGAFYRLDAGGRCSREFDGIVAANGAAFSLDGRTGYHADSATGTVWQFDCDPDDGAMTNHRPFVQLNRRFAAPDGATVDHDGCYWLTHAMGWRIARYTPAGQLDRIIQMPVEIPTSLSFGGQDGRILFVTTARYSLSPEALAIQPLAGSLLALDVGASGSPDERFAA